MVEFMSTGFSMGGEYSLLFLGQDGEPCAERRSSPLRKRCARGTCVPNSQPQTGFQRRLDLCMELVEDERNWGVALCNISAVDASWTYPAGQFESMSQSDLHQRVERVLRIGQSQSTPKATPLDPLPGMFSLRSSATCSADNVQDTSLGAYCAKTPESVSASPSARRRPRPWGDSSSPAHCRRARRQRHFPSRRPTSSSAPRRRGRTPASGSSRSRASWMRSCPRLPAQMSGSAFRANVLLLRGMSSLVLGIL